MKKRLLITSIVMMLVVAVALSTATYAWFTSNNAVSANSISLTAATNDAPSLGISWVDGNYGTSISADVSSEARFQPLAPLSLTDTTTTTGNIEFYTSTVTPTNGGTMVFANTPVTVAEAAASNGAKTAQNIAPYTWTDGTYTSFFLKNMSPSQPISSVTMRIDVTGDNEASHLLRAGVFKKNTSTGNYELLKVLSMQDANTYTKVGNDDTLATGTAYYKLYLGKYVLATAGSATDVSTGVADYEADITKGSAGDFFTMANTATNAKACYGTITANQNVNTSMSYYTCETSVVVATGLAHDQKIELKVLVWEDAVALGDAEGGTVSTISFNFTAVA